MGRSAIVLVLELEQSLERHSGSYSVLVSRPGRDGTFSRTWSNPSGRLGASQAQDLTAWVAKTVENALVAFGGIQEGLDGA